MHILILNWRDTKNPKAGGAEGITLEHAKAWVKYGCRVTWFTSRYPKSLSSEYIEGVRIVRFGNEFLVHLFAPFFYLLSSNTFDVVIDEVHGIPFFTPFYVRRPKIVFIHEIAGKIWDYMYNFPLNTIGKVLEHVYFHFYANVYFWTDAPSTVVELVAHGISKDNCIAIPCPILNKPVSTLPQKEAISTFLFVSRLVQMKGIEDVIASFAMIAEQKKDVQLWIVGSGDKQYVNSLKSMVRKLGVMSKVTFLGYLSETQKLATMRKSHILLHASVKEGWGLVVLESASQGTPAIVYNVSGLCDVVKNNKTGLVLSKNTPQEMAHVALKLLDDKNQYKNFQENGIRWVKSLSWEEVTKQSLELLKKVT